MTPIHFFSLFIIMCDNTLHQRRNAFVCWLILWGLTSLDCHFLSSHLISQTPPSRSVLFSFWSHVHTTGALQKKERKKENKGGDIIPEDSFVVDICMMFEARRWRFIRLITLPFYVLSLSRAVCVRVYLIPMLLETRWFHRGLRQCARCYCLELRPPAVGPPASDNSGMV